MRLDVIVVSPGFTLVFGGGSAYLRARTVCRTRSIQDRREPMFHPQGSEVKHARLNFPRGTFVQRL